tara:strand:+ start:676 stop:2439 length:1764 start_codon:yes stop_codon:yes gene_type:complete
LFDTGTPREIAAPETGSEAAEQPISLKTRLSDLRDTTQRVLKLYSSASRLVLGQSLGQRRWLTATGVAGIMSFSLLGAGLVALVAPYSGVETAAITAESTPQIIALDTNRSDAASVIASAAPASTDQTNAQVAPVIVASSAMAGPETPSEGDNTNAGLRDGIADEDGSDTSFSAQADAVPDNAELVTASLAPPVPELPTEISTKIELSPGATLMQVLTDHGADRVDAYHAIAALRPVFSPTKLRSGQEISLTFLSTPATGNTEDSLPTKLLTSISLQPDVESKIEVMRADDGTYTSEEIKKQLTSGFARAEGKISSSLFLDAAQAGVPAPIIVEMIRMFSYSVDFQREIHPGDSFEVFFDRKFDNSGEAVKEGDISYASLTILGKEHKLWRYKMADGNWDYFDEKGRSMKKFLMKTPIDGARISSSFGRRKHPVLGYTKMHSGVDFAAPRGTPIYAAGNGTVDYAARMGSYGNFVRIKHANGYQTAYAHMNGFARGIRKGTRVRQGQVIGYVGTTGRSTGPHLHYEIVVHGKKVNPLGIKVPTGTQLAGKDLKNYKSERSRIMAQMADTPELTRVAQVNTDDDAKAN